MSDMKIGGAPINPLGVPSTQPAAEVARPPLDPSLTVGREHGRPDAGSAAGLPLEAILPPPHPQAQEQLVDSVRRRAVDASSAGSPSDASSSLGSSDPTPDSITTTSGFQSALGPPNENAAILTILTLGDELISTNASTSQAEESLRESDLQQFKDQMGNVIDKLDQQAKSAWHAALLSGIGSITSGALSGLGSGLGMAAEGGMLEMPSEDATGFKANLSRAAMFSRTTGEGVGIMPGIGKVFEGSFGIGGAHDQYNATQDSKDSEKYRTAAQIEQTAASNAEQYRNSFNSAQQSVIQAVGQLLASFTQAGAQTAANVKS